MSNKYMFYHYISLLGFWLILCLFSPTQSVAEPDNSLHRVRHTVHKFIMRQLNYGEDIHIKYGYIDKRLKLNCNGRLTAFTTTAKLQLGVTTVGVRCGGTTTWKIYVPVTIRAYGNVVISKHALAKSSILTPQDLGFARKELSRLYDGHFRSIKHVAGMKLKRPVQAGTVLNPRIVLPRQLVKRGEPVTILAEINGLLIRVNGEALMDGKRGQLIRVQNLRSGREIHAEVVSTSTVRVKM